MTKAHSREKCCVRKDFSERELSVVRLSGPQKVLRLLRCLRQTLLVKVTRRHECCCQTNSRVSGGPPSS